MKRTFFRCKAKFLLEWRNMPNFANFRSRSDPLLGPLTLNLKQRIELISKFKYIILPFGSVEGSKRGGVGDLGRGRTLFEKGLGGEKPTPSPLNPCFMETMKVRPNQVFVPYRFSLAYVIEACIKEAQYIKSLISNEAASIFS